MKRVARENPITPEEPGALSGKILKQSTAKEQLHEINESKKKELEISLMQEAISDSYEQMKNITEMILKMHSEEVAAIRGLIQADEEKQKKIESLNQVIIRELNIIGTHVLEAITVELTKKLEIYVVAMKKQITRRALADYGFLALLFLYIIKLIIDVLH